MIEELKNKARELLETKRVDAIIGYERASDDVSARPSFIDKKEDADKLIWDAYCVYNLSKYLKDFIGKRTGIVAKPCDVQSLIVLIQEHQLNREDIFIIAVECFGVIDQKPNLCDKQAQETLTSAAKCKGCKSSFPIVSDILLRDKEGRKKLTQEDEYENIRKLEIAALEERSKLWQDEFSRCIRCYGCRQICPMCYCPKCVAEQTMPAWFSKSNSLEGNFAWNVTRAMHLAARCIDCGECERACPVGIPLRDINKKIEKDIKELFDYEAGSKIDQKPLLGCFDKNDPDDFIR